MNLPSTKTMVSIGAGVIATVIMAFSISRCNSEQKQKDMVIAQANAANKVNNEMIDSLSNALAKSNAALRDVRSAQEKDSRDLADCGAQNQMLEDSISVLNDSIAALKAKADACKNAKKKPAAKKKPVAKKTTPCKPCQPAKPACAKSSTNVDAQGDCNKVNVNNGVMSDGKKTGNINNKHCGNTDVNVNGNNNNVNVNNGIIVKEQPYVECTVRIKRTRTITYTR